MKREVRYIGPLQAALISGLLSFAFVFLLFFVDWVKWMINSEFPEPKFAGIPTAACILSFVAFCLGFVMTSIYNLLAKLIGGIQYEAQDPPTKA